MRLVRKSVYVACTPYHAMLSCGIASGLDDSIEKHLLLLGDFANAEALTGVIREWRRQPFGRIIYLPGNYGLTPGRVNVVSKRNVAALRRFHLNQVRGPCALYVYNDAKPESQALLYLNRRSGGRNIFVEDGSAVYSDYAEGPVPAYKILYAKAMWGLHYDQVRILGSGKLVDSILVFYPELVRPELRSKEARRMPENLLTGLDVELIGAVARSYRLSLDDLRADGILIAPHSESLLGAKADYRAVYGEVADAMGNRFTRTVVKYHPSETRDDLLGVGGKPDVRILPHSLPMEVLYLANLARPPRLIVDDLSTALLTARIIYGDRSNVVSMLKFLELEVSHAGLIRSFDRLGVAMPGSLGALLEQIKLL